MSSGYCPWCGAPIAVAAVNPRNGELFWDLCKSPACPGGLYRVESTAEGWVIFPSSKRNHYLFSRPVPEIEVRKP